MALESQKRLTCDTAAPWVAPVEADKVFSCLTWTRGGALPVINGL